ncbi:GFA family protein [Pseudochelatococcus lubricantis]|uniref:GFA family protein n=1 Tax=Pseudochelatococcus lubricantis TaxID=1538102 RepID=UPI0035EEC5B6
MSHAVLNARCLCGAVEFTAVPENDEAGVCHCSMCQRWSGGIWFARRCGELTMVKGDALGIYDSSEWGERGFCRECGSSLFWRQKDGAHNAVAVAAFGEHDGVRLTSEIFYDVKPDYYALANETEKMTEAETIAFFTGGQDGNHG